jgi:very-short-patch-repair endonuclease
VTAETLVTGIEDELLLDERTTELARIALEKGDALYYGYPTAVVQADKGQDGKPQFGRQVAPLFLVELALPASMDHLGESLAVKSDLPFLHPGVLARFGVKNEQMAALIEAFSIEPHQGSPAALQTFLLEVAAEVGIPIPKSLDPSRLHSPAEGEIDAIGLHNVAMVFRAGNSSYTEGLLKELRNLRGRWAEAQTTAAALLIPSVRAQLSPLPPAEVSIAAPLSLNESQRQALVGAFSGRLALVTGPPGTGKSQLVTNVIATAWMSEKTVLVASNNNQAVNVVCERAQKVWKGLIIRTGSSEHRKSARELLHSLLQDRSPVPDLEAVKPGLEASRARLRRVEELIEQRTRIENRLPEIIHNREYLARRLGYDLAALPQAIQGRALARRWHQGLRLQRARVFKEWRTARFVRALQLNSPFQIPEAVCFLEAEATWRDLLEQERTLPSIETLLREKAEAERLFQSASEAAVRSQAVRTFEQGRSKILPLAQARSIANDRNPAAVALTAALPFVRAWATTSLSVGANLPLHAGLFDLVIVDEASQCAIPAIVPLLFRARRALIIGDPNQLSHITSMSRKEEEALLDASGLERGFVERQGLSYRSHSIYRALEPAAPQSYVLDEHYRCHPQIIEISNRIFYGKSLAILTDPSRLFDFGPQACAWRHVEGKTVRPSSGSAENRQEAQAVIEELLRIATKRGFTGSVGVVTPFSAQAGLIERLAGAQISSEIREKIHLAVGTAHRFQGDERDVILLSPVVSDGVSEGSLRWILGTPNLFNVGITRARSYLLVVGNQVFCERLRDGTERNVLKELALYARSLENQTRVQDAASRGDLHSAAEVRLYEALLSLGLSVQPKRMVQGYECDFALELQGMLVNVECDGFHHQDGLGRLRIQDRARDRLLEQVGWKVIRVPAWKCLGDPSGAAQEIARALKS